MQISTVGWSCRNRSRTPRQPKSGETLVQIAPIDVTASIAMTASGMFGSVEATRSPGRTPRRRSWVARIRTFPAKSSQSSGVTGTVSEW